MTALLVALGGLVAFAAVLLVAGATSPRRHLSTVELSLPRPPEEVWAVVSKLEDWPSWNAAVSSMKLLGEHDGKPRWEQGWGRERMCIDVLEHTAPTRLVTRIVDDGLPFGGTWTWALTAEPGGTRVSVVEDGEVRSVLFRGMARLFFGHTGTQQRALTGLARRFGVDARLSMNVTFPR
ncbi:MAG: SRPBCC family protein [Myxococcota bacterium]